MAKTDDARTTINVKGVSVTSWEKARKAATQEDVTMGTWLSQAIDHLANLQAGPREFPPLPAANPEPPAGNPIRITPEAYGAMMQGVSAVVLATGVMPAKADIRRAYHLGDAIVREAQGLPPRKAAGVERQPAMIGHINGGGKAIGQSLPSARQS